ncbi:MAG: PadR family transcriptional regulator [Treponema sp.]|jgi:PadR family transcriptional regulator PadR|nr:PadR family transcriptional regulator [Treponema sp.]
MKIIIGRDIIRNHIDTIILHLLTEQDRYEYEICTTVSVRSDGAYVLKAPSLYSAFRRLESAQLVDSYWGNDRSKGARRKYYRITQAGIEYYRHTVEEWRKVKGFMDTLLGEEPPAHYD